MTYLVILDAGHGLDTPGKRTPLFPDGSFMHENEFNRSVVRKIDALLEQYENIDVVFTTTEKREIGLPERVVRVNDLYDKVKTLYDKIVLISVHANALTGEWGSQNGTETYYYPTNPVDKSFAQVIHKHLVQATGLRDRGVIGEAFYIIKNVKMTSCLCECAFMDNLNEAKLLLSDEFRQDCAEGIVKGLKEYFGMNSKEGDSVKVEYKEYSNGMTEIKGDAKDIGTAIVDKIIWNITEFTNFVNGTFFHINPDGTTYATSILYQNGKTYQDVANHFYDFGTPQSVFIVYKDNTVDLKRIKFLSELDLSKVKFVAGGVGLRNTQDANFYYSPVKEGFKKGKRFQDNKEVDYTDVLKKRNKTVLGYNKKLNKCYLLTVPSVSHGELIKLISTGEYYDIAISLDGGGSTCMDALGKYVFQGQNSRRIHNIIGFGL